MGAFKDYNNLEWSHPLRRLAEFRSDEEKLPGNDWMFCSRMGITQNQRLRMYKEPDLIRIAELVEICKRLKLNDKQTHWVLAAATWERKGKERPPSVLEWVIELAQIDVKKMIACGAPISFLIIADMVYHGHHFLF